MIFVFSQVQKLKTTTLNFKSAYKILTIFIAIVWLVNGLFCKILNFVPRHQEIVDRILGDEYASLLTMTIGGFEMLMVVWILSGYKSKLNALTQIAIILIMNVIELILARDLLLYGYGNIVFAFVFTTLIYLNEFQLKDKYVKS